MITTSLTRLALAGGLAISLALGAGVAAAAPGQPDQPGQPGQPGAWSQEQNPAVTTTCTYTQVLAAMNAQSPDVAAQFNTTPAAQSFLQNFLAAPPPQREQMLQQAQGAPEAAQFVNLVGPIAKTCSKY